MSALTGNPLPVDWERVDTMIMAVLTEVQIARSKFGPFGNLHEAYAVILEELDEFWGEVRIKQDEAIRKNACRNELIQVAAMCICAMVECT